MYMMVMRDQQVKFFADASINIDPDAETLADIAIQVSDAVEAMGIAPKVAMVSFSNFGSVSHPEATKVRRALDLVRAARPALQVDGEMQADVALDKTAMAGFPFCQLGDAANVLIFPTLAAGNAAYKVLSVLGGAQPIGPIILGLAKPVMVLQKHASVEDVVNMTGYIAAIAQSHHDAR
jgi:malate dehydrogenase (oxaloacetate-decarboxylating)(NADP+)